jgi:hypothetical protein
VKFIQQSIRELEAKGHKVRLAGIVYHLGENDMSFYPYRKEAAGRLQTTIGQSRKDFGQPELKWFVSQQPPTDEKGVNRIDVVADMEKVAAVDPNLIHIKAFDLPPQKKRLVLDTAGVIALGRLLGERIAEGD